MESLRSGGTSAPCGRLCKVWTALAGRSGVADHVVDRAHQRIQVHRLDEDAGGPIPLLVLHLVQQFRKGGGHQQRDIRRLRCGVEALHELPRLWLPTPTSTIRASGCRMTIRVKTVGLKSLVVTP